MFNKKTVFVVGAGGSKELGLPTGDQLKDVISDKLTVHSNQQLNLALGDRKITEAIYEIVRAQSIRDVSPYVSACRNIARAMPQALSIDNYLHTHYANPKIVEMGKLAITAAILNAEKESLLYADEHQGHSHDFRTASGVWHNTFCKMLTENVQRNNLDTLFENVSFISFNYDRCIEHYVARWLESYMLLKRSDAEALTSELTVLHPYGQVGKLPWQPIQMDAVAFGAEVAGPELASISQNIRTFTERIQDDTVPERMKQLLTEARQIVYLGFSFGQMNMQLMKIDECNVPKSAFGTSLGISGANMDFIKDALSNDFQIGGQGFLSGMHFPPYSCAQFLTDYSRVLTG